MAKGNSKEALLEQMIESLKGDESLQTTLLMGSHVVEDAPTWSSGANVSRMYSLNFSNGEFASVYVKDADASHWLRACARWTRVNLYGKVIYCYYERNQEAGW